MTRLAVFGGSPAVPPGMRRLPWPIVEDRDEAAVMRVLRSGRLVANAEDEPEVRGLEAEWARAVGVDHCVAVGDGTAALSVALSALGIGRGDEVLVPALTFVATALAVLHAGAEPVFVDVDPRSFTMDVADAAAKLTPRSAALLPVHLHGHPADMDAIRSLARDRGLVVLEDAAQSHGATYRGCPAGGMGNAGAFSLNATKNLPTCGEGGLVTTNEPTVAARARMLRQFGEIMRGRTRDYVSYAAGRNDKMSPVQAAFAREQLRRFPGYEAARKRNVEELLGSLGELPGLTVPSVAPGCTHAWHILRFRFSSEAAGVADSTAESFRRALHRVLRAEGVPVSRYQVTPLPAQDTFRHGARADLPFPPESHGTGTEEYRDRFPTTAAVIDDSLTIQRRHLNPHARDLLLRYADAFHKVWDNLETVALIARAHKERVLS